MARGSDEDDVNQRLRLTQASQGAMGTFTPSALLVGRVLSGCATLGFAVLLVWVCATDGSPFRSSLLTPWMQVTLVDYYLTLSPFLLWVGWRHRAVPLTAVLLVLYCCCLGSCAVWSYVWLTLMRIRAGEPVTRLLGPL